MSDYGEVLKKLIRFTDMKMSAAADIAGYDISYISKWCNKSKLPAARVAGNVNRNLAKAFAGEIKNNGDLDAFCAEFSVSVRDEQLETYIYTILKEAFKSSLSFNDSQVRKNVIHHARVLSNRRDIVDYMTHELPAMMFTSPEPVEALCTFDIISMLKNIPIEAEADPTTPLKVRGIVGPSLVNQSGFYLIDESGVIAVKLSSYDLFDGTFHIGDEVVIEGYRDYWGSKGVQSQICITDAYIYANEYGGDGTYPTDSFITGKTIAELVNLPVSELEHTAEVYVIDKASLTVSDGYYPTYYLIDEGEKDYGSKGLQFYQSGSAQYAWLQSYLGQTFKAEIALCNWNSKSAFKVCVLSITLEDGTQIYNTLNFGSAE